MDWRDRLDGYIGIFTRGEIPTGTGVRNWHGYEVDKKGYLTGREIVQQKYQEIGINPQKITRFLSILSRMMMTSSGRADILAKVRSVKLRNVLKALYRPNAKIGNDSSMDAYRWEKATGGLVGGKEHGQKLADYQRALQNVLKEQLNNFDKRTTTELLNDIINALKGN